MSILIKLLSGEGLNYLNIALIVVSLVLAYIIPFELLLLAYAFLGPAHYFSEISWLHNRQYFTVVGTAGKMLCIGIALTILTIYATPFILYIALVGASVLVVLETWKYRIAIATVLILAGWLVQATAGFSLVFFILLPTVIHVFIFTALFMMQGALRSKSIVGGIAVALLLVGGMSFFIIPPLEASETLSRFASLHGYYFDEVRTGVLGLLGKSVEWNAWVSVSGFLSFAYLYHYLNWFSKTKIIGWHMVSKTRSLAIIGASFAAAALYFYDYKIGFAALVIISLLHVVLEFPLNIVTIRSLGQSCFAYAATTVLSRR